MGQKKPPGYKYPSDHARKVHRYKKIKGGHPKRRADMLPHRDQDQELLKETLLRNIFNLQTLTLVMNSCERNLMVKEEVMLPDDEASTPNDVCDEGLEQEQQIFWEEARGGEEVAEEGPSYAAVTEEAPSDEEVTPHGLNNEGVIQVGLSDSDEAWSDEELSDDGVRQQICFFTFGAGLPPLPRAVKISTATSSTSSASCGADQQLPNSAGPGASLGAGPSSIGEPQEPVSPFACTLCNKVCGSANGLMLHKKRWHSKTNFMCHGCNLNFPNLEILEKHLLTHTVKRWPCKDCGKSFPKHRTLEYHARLHNCPYICNVCCRGYISQKKLIQHKRTHLGKKLVLLEEPVPCNLCEKIFLSKFDFNNHVKKMHPTPGENEKDQNSGSDGTAFAAIIPRVIPTGEIRKTMDAEPANEILV